MFLPTPNVAMASSDWNTPGFSAAARTAFGSQRNRSGNVSWPEKENIEQKGDGTEWSGARRYQQAFPRL